MNDMTRPAIGTLDTNGAPRESRGLSRFLWFALPLLALFVAAAWLIASDWLKAFDTGVPPVEKITVERTILDNAGIRLKVRAGGSDSITIAQVQVDEAYWTFTQEPSGAIDRLASVWLHIPYPWVLGEKHEIKLLTRTGAIFKTDIEVAVATPQAQTGQLVPQAMLGAFVGIVPVVIGMLFFPAMRGMGRAGRDFVLALTVGLLVFLFIDSLRESLELAEKIAAAFQGTMLVLLVTAATFLILFVVGRRHGTPSGPALATYIALGIGLHNLGEGLAIGAAFAAGIAGLGAFLVLGFTLHNVTEGIGIVAPLTESKPKPPLAVFAGLALLAGAPAIVGIWLGSLSYSPHWSALALAIGAGAILQVIVEVSAYLTRSTARSPGVWLTPSAVCGLIAGVGVMYVTAMFVKV